jgi:acetolactate synthase-1/2/3 large subunit
MDSVPLVVFTGQVAMPLLGRDSFQEADITGITLPITKHNYLVKDTKDLARIIKEAFHIASTGRPGPVVIDLPRDISTNTARFDYPKTVNLRGYRILKKVNMLQVNQAAQLINQSRRPILYVGGGAVTAGAHREVLELAEKAGIPVTTTLMGIGSFPGTNRLALGMLGMHGTRYANYAVCNCDCLIAVGARFDDRVTGKVAAFAPKAKIVHIDIDPAEIGKNVRVDVPIAGDVRLVLSELNPRIEANIQERQAWLEQIAQWKKEYPLQYEPSSDKIKPQQVIQQIYEATKGEAIITTEVGQHQMWTAQYYTFNRPRTLVTSGGLGTMGFGLPAAVGAQIGCPDALVFDISGDGSFQMNSQELATAVAYRLPIKIAVINNGYLGMVRQWQQLFHGGRYSQTDIFAVNPDFVKLAEAYGVLGLRAERPEEVRPALEKAIATPGPVLIDFAVDREENVFPMVPPGGTLDNMMWGCAE